MIKRVKNIRFNGRIFVVFIFLALITGCANLTAIREFADISAQSADYTGLVDNYVESPVRQKWYQPDSMHESLETTNKQRQEQKERLKLRHMLIEEYMDALGQLAADEIVTYNKEIDALGKAVQQNKFLDKKEAAAFSAISKVLVKAVSDNWRRRKLKNLVDKSNDSFQIVVGSLKKIVDEGFSGDIENERLAINKYYKGIIVQSNEKACIAVLNEWRELKNSKIEERKKAIKDYSTILNKISRGHQDLYDNRKKMSRKELLAQMRHYAKDIGTLYISIKNL